MTSSIGGPMTADKSRIGPGTCPSVRSAARQLDRMPGCESIKVPSRSRRIAGAGVCMVEHTVSCSTAHGSLPPRADTQTKTLTGAWPGLTRPSVAVGGGFATAIDKRRAARVRRAGCERRRRGCPTSLGGTAFYLRGVRDVSAVLTEEGAEALRHFVGDDGRAANAAFPPDIERDGSRSYVFRV